MPFSWSDAAEHATNSDAAGRYRRACQQLLELHSLVQSFRRAVLDSEKWPLEDFSMSENYIDLQPGTLRTSKYPGGVNQRFLTVGHTDGRWALHAPLRETDKFTFHLATVNGDGSVDLGDNLADAMASADFDPRMDAIERSKDWVPLNLLGYLQRNGIPVPSDG